MKKTMKTMLLFASAILILASCKKNPPVAGFTLSNDAPVQWDMITITSTASGADEATYTVTGGEFEMDEATATVQFLEAATYTITQSVTNVDGTANVSEEVIVTEPVNTYTLEGTEYIIGTTDYPNAYWYDASAQGGTVYIRMQGDVAGQDNPNLLKLYPVTGPNALQATYTWSDTGDIGTYDAGVTANYAGFVYDWTTSGNDGGDLLIELVYTDAANSENNIYDITLASYELNWGNWDFASCFCFISEGTKTFSVSYRGKIDPAG